MRIRTIKPEFWTSATVAQLDWETRLVLKGLESYVDDNGVGVHDIQLIVTQIFPRDFFQNPVEIEKKVKEAIRRLSEAGFLWLYEAEHVAAEDGRTVPALYISNWERLQRINKPQNGRYRRPDGTLSYDESSIREPKTANSSNGKKSLEVGKKSLEIESAVTGEQGSRGAGEQGNSSLRTSTGVETAPNTKPTTYSQQFENWWAGYPIKRDKARAYKAFKNALKRADLETLTQGRDAYAQWAQAHPDRELKYAEGWLNGDRWEDDLTTGTPRPVARIDKWQKLANQLDTQEARYGIDR